jgi:uncharacterized protein YndB with AHSA1/START domain
MTRSITHKYFFPHPPVAVWEYLTKPELIEQWLMKSDFQPIVGLDFQFRINPIPSLDFDGIFYCKILEVVPFKRLSYSWKSGPGEGRITLESIVQWKLEPTANGTDLFLEHSGFTKTENLDFYQSLYHGWLEKLQKIDHIFKSADHVATKP